MARLEITGTVVPATEVVEGAEKPTFTIVLSKRNLLALLHKVDEDWSAKTLTNDYVFVNGQDIGSGVINFVIKCEPDDEHYAKRDTPPGPMHPATETFIAKP